MSGRHSVLMRDTSDLPPVILGTPTMAQPNRRANHGVSLTRAVRRSGALVVAGLLGVSIGLQALPAHAAGLDPSDPEVKVGRDPAALRQMHQNPTVRADVTSRAAKKVVTRNEANAAITTGLLTYTQTSPNTKYIGSNYAMLALDPATNSTLFSRKADSPMTPASNQKVLTSAAVLHEYGGKKRWLTRVVENGKGSVVIIGRGDPSLGEWGLGEMAKTTAAEVVKRGLLPDIVTPKPYVPATCVDPKTKKSRKSTKKAPCPVVTPKPYRPALKVMIDSSYFPAPTPGAGWGGYAWAGPVTAISSYAGEYFAQAMGKSGVSATFGGWQTAKPGSARLATYTGSQLKDIVRWMMLPSDNNSAERLLRHVAIARGYYPTWKNSRKALVEALNEMGVPTANVRPADGSGLSSYNTVTTRALASVMTKALDKTNYPQLESLYYGGAEHIPGLPTAGISGTLSASAGRFNEWPSNCAVNRLWAKTGTLSSVVALSGITKAADGTPRVFSIVVNNIPGAYQGYKTLPRNTVDAMAAAVTGCWTPKPPKPTKPTPAAKR